MQNILNKIYFATALVLTSLATAFAQTVTVPTNCVVVSTNTALGGILGAGGKVTAGGIVTMPDGTTPNGGAFTFAGPAGAVLSPTISWNLSGDLSAPTATLFDAPVQPENGATATIISYNKKLNLSEKPSLESPSNNTSWARSKGRVTVVYSGNSLVFDVFKTFTATPAIVGPDCVEVGKSYTFSVDQVASDNAGDAIGFDQYYWSGLPANIKPNSLYYSADNSSVTFTPTSNAPFTLKCCIGRANPWDGGISVTPALPNFTTTFTTKTVSAAPTEPIVGTTLALLSSIMPLYVPTGTTDAPAQFTINYISVNVCRWEMPTGWTIAKQVANPSQGTQWVTINTNGFNTPGVLKLTVSSGFCTALKFEYQINRK